MFYLFHFIYFNIRPIKEVIITGLIAPTYLNHDMQNNTEKWITYTKDTQNFPEPAPES